MMNKKELIEIVLKKRFGEENPENIPCLFEVNTFSPADDEENTVGMGVQLIIEKNGQDNIKEEYQVNKDGVVFSWGDTPVIDEKSLDHKLTGNANKYTN